MLLFSNPCRKKIFHQAEASIFAHKCDNGQTLIISLTGKMHTDTIENYKDISSGIISYSSTPPTRVFSFPPFLSFICVILYVCAQKNVTDLTQSLSSLETQWSHLISHASDALMNQHMLACQHQAGVAEKYTSRHFSQTGIKINKENIKSIKSSSKSV